MTLSWRSLRSLRSLRRLDRATTMHHLIGSYKSFTHSVEYLYDTQLALRALRRLERAISCAFLVLVLYIICSFAGTFFITLVARHYYALLGLVL
jgi:hypothetical protein